MQPSKKNELLIGFTVSILLSLFVNFSLLMRSYENAIATSAPPGKDNSPGHAFLYFSLLWFFLLAFFLFLINREGYRLGERWIRRKEYRILLLLGALSAATAYGMFRLYPEAHNLILSDLLELAPPLQDDPHTQAVFITQKRMAAPSASPFTGALTRPAFPVKMEIEPAFPFPRPLVTEHLFVLLTMLLSVSLLRMLNSRQQIQLEYEQLKTEKLRTSYNALMGQINPHFFFNSLNGLNALIRNGEQERTLTYLDELSNVFRYILQSNQKALVTLAEELQFVKAYTYLLSVRYEGKLFFSIQADPPYLLWYLPILSILPLVENAVKHNVISKQHPLQIDIYTTAEPFLVISNQTHPKMEEGHSSGIGLKNLWGRYRMLTGKDLRIENRKGYFKVSLPLLNTRPQP